MISKILTTIFILTFFAFPKAFGTEWEILRQALVPSHLRDVFFVDQNTGWTVGGSGMILHTTDGGLTWTKQDSGTKKALQSVYFIDANEGWIVGSGEIYSKGGERFVDETGSIVLHTEDAGQTWRRQEIDFNYVSLQVVQFINAEEGWIGGVDADTWTSLILYTKDGGQTWKRQEVPRVELGPMILDLSFVNSKSGWAVAMSEVFATKDGGETWKLVRENKRNDIDSVYFASENEGWIGGRTFEVDANGKAKIFCSIYHTRDGGSSWEEIRLLERAFYGFTDIQFLNPQKGWVLVFDLQEGGFVFHTNDGGKSYDKQFTFPRFMFHDGLQALSFVDEEHGWLVGHSGRIWATSDGGKRWVAQGNEEDELATLNAVSFVDDNSGWAVGDNGTIIHTTDSGITWQQQRSGAIYDISDVQFVNSEEGWFTSEHKLFRTRNGGRTWKMEQDDAGRALYFIDVDEGWCAGGFRLINNQVYLSDIDHTQDGGKIWFDQTPKEFLKPPRHQLRDVYFVNSQKGWVVGHLEKWAGPDGQEGVIYHTTDGGDTWQLQEQTQEHLRSVRFVSAQEGWAVGEKGAILYTNDGGKHWEEQNSGTNADLLKIDYAGGKYIWAVGQWGAVLRLAPPSLERRVVEPSEKLLLTNWGKLKTALYQNYPNPFNPETWIPFSIARDANVTIKIYDISGKLIKSLNIGEKRMGTYTQREKAAHWDGRNQNGESVSSGVYFYVLEVDGVNMGKRKLTLVK